MKNTKTLTSELLDIEDVFSASLAPRTRKVYAKCWHEFAIYCKQEGITPLEATAEQVANFFIWIANQPRPKSMMGEYLKMGTLVQIKSAIARRFKDNDKTSPTSSAKVELALKGLARLKGNKPRQVKALTDKHIKKILTKIDYEIRRYSTMPPSERSLGDRIITKKRGKWSWTYIQRAAKLYRDASILSLGFAAALRRSEIMGIKVEHLEFIKNSNKMILHIPKSKTDQEGLGQQIPIIDGKSIQPIRRLKEWLNVSGIKRGYVYVTLNRAGSFNDTPLHFSDIPRIIKRYGKSIGLNPKEISGHSLRAGFVTSAAAHKASLHKIMEITRHTSPVTVMKYIREANSFKDHAGGKFL